MTHRAWRTSLVSQVTLTQAAAAGIRLAIGYRAIELGADLAFMGLVVSSLALLPLVVSVPAGRFTDRVGGTPLVLSGIVVTGGSIVLTLAVPELWALVATAAAAGTGIILVVIGDQKLVAQVSDSNSRDGAFGLLSSAASLGQMLGPPAAAFVATLGSSGKSVRVNTALGLVTLAAALALALPFCFVLRSIERELRRDTTVPTASPRTAVSLLRAPGMWRAVLVSGSVLVAIDLLYTFLPVWATERSIDPRIVGMLLAERAAVSVLSRLGLGRLVAVLGRRRLLTAAIAGSALALAALPFCGVAGAIIVMAVAGCGLGIPQPVTMSWVVSLTAPHLQGTALGLRLTANNLAQLTYPAIIGAAANPFGAVGVFAMTAGLLAVSVFLVAPFRD